MTGEGRDSAPGSPQSEHPQLHLEPTPDKREGAPYARQSLGALRKEPLEYSTPVSH